MQGEIQVIILACSGPQFVSGSYFLTKEEHNVSCQEGMVYMMVSCQGVTWSGRATYGGMSWFRVREYHGQEATYGGRLWFRVR